jgi:hypothetical protein
MQTDLDILRHKVLDVAHLSGVAEQVGDIDLEADQDSYGFGIVRITLRMKAFDRTKDEEMLALMKSIEETVSNLDDRSPIVYFADAA